MSKLPLLAVGVLPPFLVERLRDTYDYHHIADEQGWTDALTTLAPQIRAIAATGESKVPRSLQDRLPNLQIISVFGVGYDGVDAVAAHARGIAVTHTPDVLTDDVADMAFALLLSTARAVVRADGFVRAGHWARGPHPFTRKVSGQRMGILGLGRIGAAIAKRAEGFGMSVAYTNRKPVPGSLYRYVADPVTLAAECDFFVVATNGGAATRGLVDAKVLAALGPDGILVNIGRGSVVDEPALIAALESRQIAGAGLDVFVDEPHVPAALLAMENVVLTPHMASGTTTTRHAMAALAYDNLAAHFAGHAVLTPVPTA
ncbi:2-hydroxyacid dehydrogenase [Acidisphaera sp. L21]|uniref:2-hydroxyacid dehydrogenase n=1 Tax=Acidisphaera sp. L21 TaxID=1641851 RepID=UPI00131C2C84|nr:2-hydroxyacid dehydrogenase [Acidisphaera sp. L21]